VTEREHDRWQRRLASEKIIADMLAAVLQRHATHDCHYVADYVPASCIEVHEALALYKDARRTD